MTPRARFSARTAGALHRARANIATAVLAAALVFSAPSKPQAAEPRAMPRASEFVEGQEGPRRLAALEVGLSGPPVVGADGGWWLLGRDGEVLRFRADDSLLWSISLGSSITGPAAADEQGHLVYIPTARDHVVALDVTARVHWKYRAPAGIVGPVTWVPKLGLAFVGRDRALYWLDHRANLVLRVPLKARVSAGPTPFGSQVVLGTEEGQLVSFTRQGQRQTAELGAPVTALVATATNALALAGTTAHWLDSKLRVVWSRSHVLGIGVTAARGHEQRPPTPVILSAEGKAEWLDSGGEVIQRSGPMPARDHLLVPRLLATESTLWAADASGSLWEARGGGEWSAHRLSPSGLSRPVLDVHGGRVLVGGFDGSAFSRKLDWGSSNSAKVSPQQ